MSKMVSASRWVLSTSILCTGIGTDNEAAMSEGCYAQLLKRCLLDAPPIPGYEPYTRPLKDIYAWMSEHCEKARSGDNKGWKNSVRHNLSMNEVSLSENLSYTVANDADETTQAFNNTKVPARPGGPTTLAAWFLNPDYVRNEWPVRSTTVFREKPSKAKNSRPDPNRQASGKKGGIATRSKRRLHGAAAETRARAPTPAVRRQHRTQMQNNSSIEDAFKFNTYVHVPMSLPAIRTYGLPASQTSSPAIFEPPPTTMPFPPWPSPFDAQVSQTETAGVGIHTPYPGYSELVHSESPNNNIFGNQDVFPLGMPYTPDEEIESRLLFAMQGDPEQVLQ